MSVRDRAGSIFSVARSVKEKTEGLAEGTVNGTGGKFLVFSGN